MDTENTITKKQLRKAKAPRSRTGCRVCRSRHIKCDETRPFCRNCHVSGRKCDGYPTPKSGDEKTSPVSPLSADASLIVTNTLPRATDERSHFYYFSQKTAPELSGYFDADFYNAITLQISRDQPAVRHAIISLGALHESIRLDDLNKSRLKTLSLHHYTKAIQSLAKVSANKSQSVSVTLTCCILFIWIETLTGNHVMRMQQLNSGLKILREWQRSATASAAESSPDAQFIRDYLEPIYTRLDLQGVSFENGRLPQLELHRRLENPRSPGMPVVFTSTKECRDWLDVIFYWLHNAMHSNRDRMGPGRLLVQDEGQLLLEQWEIAVIEFLRLGSNISEGQIRAAGILRICAKMAAIMVGTKMSRNELDYEPYNAHFQDIMDIVESLFEASHGTGALDGYQFSFEMGVVAPLFYISTKCHEQEIRTRALMMLLKCPKKGGVWEGLGLAKMTSLTPEGIATDITIGQAPKNPWVDRYDAAVAVGSNSPKERRSPTKSPHQ